MKIVINSCYGGYGISKEAKEILGINIKRTDKKLIALIKERGSEFVSSGFAKLEIVDIPDNATDWEIDEYDGWESITYVIDGKIHHM